MEIIQGGRQHGKTTALLKMLEQNEDAVMICVDMREVVRVREVIEREKYRIDPNRITSAQSTWGAHRGGPVYVDNLDLVLRVMFGDVQAATTTDPVFRVPLSRREVSKVALHQKFEFRTLSDAFGAQQASATCTQCGAMTSFSRGHPIEGQPPVLAVHEWARQHRCPPGTSSTEEGA